MRISSFSAIIESQYGDSMDVLRYKKGTNADGTTSNSLEPVPVASNIKCKVSNVMLEKPSDSDVSIVPLESTLKIFCSLSVDILPTDVIVARKKSDLGVVLITYKGTAGLPSFFPTHKEVLFNVEEVLNEQQRI